MRLSFARAIPAGAVVKLPCGAAGKVSNAAGAMPGGAHQRNAEGQDGKVVATGGGHDGKVVATGPGTRRTAMGIGFPPVPAGGSGRGRRWSAKMEG